MHTMCGWKRASSFISLGVGVLDIWDSRANALPCDKRVSDGSPDRVKVEGIFFFQEGIQVLKWTDTSSCLAMINTNVVSTIIVRSLDPMTRLFKRKC